MAFLARLFGGGSKFDDAKIVDQAMIAVTEDPMIADPSTLVITSEKGVITLSGPVHRVQERDRIEGVVRSALTNIGLKHERLVNNLEVVPPSK